MMHGALEDISKAVGHTPIVRLNRVASHVPAEIYVKCEYLNPGGSHKDRLAANMLRRAEENGLKPGGTIVEATSGNTGASLALLAALRGYRCVFVMPDKMSVVGYRPEQADTGLQIRSGSGSGALTQVLRTLDGGAPDPVSVAVHEPTLDDVFHALTQGGKGA